MAALAGKLRAWRSDCAPAAGKSTLNRKQETALPNLQLQDNPASRWPDASVTKDQEAIHCRGAYGKGSDEGWVANSEEKILDFASYWKEIAVVLAALFAIAGTVFEVKDKASHRITIWGRIFFGLTILSMIGGFYAQWEENARDALRNKQSQDDMLKVIENIDS